MKKLFRNIIFLINIFFGVCLFFATISVYISPAKVWPIAFFGLAFPYLLVINGGFVIFWLYRIKPHFLISLVFIILSWHNIGNYLTFQKRCKNIPPDSSYKIISYNVRLLNYYNWNSNKSSRDSILSFLNAQQSDIICLQEFISNEYNRNNPWHVNNMLSKLDDSLHAHQHLLKYGSAPLRFGTITLSKYPIVNKGVVEFNHSLNSCTYTDIKLVKDTIRVYNCHLQSIKFNKNNIRFVDSLKLEYNQQQIDEIKDISKRLKNAFIKRAEQVKTIKMHANSSPYPVIICGDFNDTPVSYTYHKLKKNMTDAFINCGTGIGYTYKGNFPSYRIDYILFNKEMKIFDFQRTKLDYSDHYPIEAMFNIIQ